MILWSDAVTDRTQEDVDLANKLLAMNWDDMTAKQQELFVNGLKGSLNNEDLNRIQSNIQLLSDVLELNLDTDYSESGEKLSTVNESYFQRLHNNVEAIRNAYAIHSDTPKTPDMTLNTYQKINAIEKILNDVHSILINNFNYYCGTEIYAGDSTGLLL